jgi:hypothetical protein
MSARDRENTLMPLHRFKHAALHMQRRGLQRPRPLLFGMIFAVAASAGCLHARSKSTPAGTPQAAAIGSSAQPMSREGAIGPKEELQVHCEQLAHATPGLEELRMKKDGMIESRQWTLIAHDSAPRWALVRAKNQPRDGWAPKPGIAKLDFKPPLEPALATGFSQFLAYAPVDVENYEDAQTATTLNEVFGGAQGKFQWRGRTYGYALTRKLPCYPLLQ